MNHHEDCERDGICDFKSTIDVQKLYKNQGKINTSGKSWPFISKSAFVSKLLHVFNWEYFLESICSICLSKQFRIDTKKKKKRRKGKKKRKKEEGKKEKRKTKESEEKRIE